MVVTLTFNSSTSWSNRCRLCNLQNTVLVGQAVARALGHHQGCPDSIPGGVDMIRAGLIGFEAGVSPNTFVSHGNRRYETHPMSSVFRSTQEGYIATFPASIGVLP